MALVVREEPEEDARPIKRRRSQPVKINDNLYYSERVDLNFVTTNSVHLVIMIGTSHPEIKEQPEEFLLFCLPVLDDMFFDWIPVLVRGVSLLTQMEEQKGVTLVQADTYELGLPMLYAFFMKVKGMSYAEVSELMDNVGLDAQMCVPPYKQLRLYQKMDGSIDLRNHCYRQFLYATFVIEFWRAVPPLHRAPNPFETLRVHLPRFFSMVGSQMNKDAVEDHVLHYCCGNCNMMLFSQRSVIEGMEWDLTEDNQNSTQEIVEQCTTLIVEPLHWMHILPDSIDGYEINCFNCHFSIGVFDPCGFPCHHYSAFGYCSNHPFAQTRLFSLYPERLSGARYTNGQLYLSFPFKP